MPIDEQNQNDSTNIISDKNGLKRLEINEINANLEFDKFSSETSDVFKHMKFIICVISAFVVIFTIFTSVLFQIISNFNTQPQHTNYNTERITQIDSNCAQHTPTVSKDSSIYSNKKNIINTFTSYTDQTKTNSEFKLWTLILLMTLFYGSIITITILILKRYKNLQDHLLENRDKDNELNRKLLYEKVKFYEGFLKSKIQNETIQLELYQRSKNEQINEVIHKNEHTRKLDFKYYELESERLKKSYDFATILKDFLK